MSKAQRLFIKSKFDKSLRKLVKWGDHIHYFKGGKLAFSYSKKVEDVSESGEEDFKYGEGTCFSYLQMEKARALVTNKWRRHVH